MPLSDDKGKYCKRILVPRHRAGIGSKDSDAIVVIVSEEKQVVFQLLIMSLIRDVKDEALKRILPKFSY